MRTLSSVEELDFATAAMPARVVIAPMSDHALLEATRAGDEAVDFNPADERPLQDVNLVENERRAAISRAISTLPEKYRAPLVLRDVQGKSYDEIAAILATSEGTVKSRINRARNFLRDKMHAYL